MLRTIGFGLAACFIALVPLAANAGEVHNRVNHEQSRINAGVASGQLTRHEYTSLDRRLDGINAARRHDLARDNGRLTRAQTRNLNRRENALSDSIYFDKHNRARQPGTPR